MNSVKIMVWEEDDAWFGYLLEYPDYWPHADNLDDLKEHLRDLFTELSAGSVAGARRVENLVVS